MPSLHSIAGSILGVAVGDAIGLPYEGLSPRRARRIFGEPDRHRFLLGHGMVSDDTEHTCMVAQSLIESGDDIDQFRRQLARRLCRWFLCLPAGTGMATAKACVRLGVGISPERSGVFSAGNGPAMRSPVLGAALDDVDLFKQFVRASARITHSDPKAEYAALTVALAAHLAGTREQIQPGDFVDRLRLVLAEDSAEELCELLGEATASVSAGQSTEAFALAQGLDKGVSGYAYHSVPVAIHAWLRHPHDFQEAVLSVVRCGGDTDSTGAIVGGIVGCSVGMEGIPGEWLQGLWEWPRTVTWMNRLAETLYECRTAGQTVNPPCLPTLGVLSRNLFFLGIVLRHGFRRLLPPY